MSCRLFCAQGLFPLSCCTEAACSSSLMVFACRDLFSISLGGAPSLNSMSRSSQTYDIMKDIHQTVRFFLRTLSLYQGMHQRRTFVHLSRFLPQKCTCVLHFGQCETMCVVESFCWTVCSTSTLWCLATDYCFWFLLLQHGHHQCLWRNQSWLEFQHNGQMVRQRFAF